MRLTELVSMMRCLLRPVRSVFGRWAVGWAASALMAQAAFAVPEITVSQASSVLSSGGSFAFGETRSDRSLLKVFTITNEGDTDLTISNVTVDAPFQITVPPAALVGPGRRTVVRVNLPAGVPAGAVTGMLTISNDDANEGTFVVTLTGVVQPVAPDIHVVQRTVPVPDEGTLDFGTVEAGLGQARVLTILNTGNSTLNVGTPTISGQGFRFEFPKNVPLRPGKRLNLTVRFTGASRGSFEGLLTIPSNDPDGEAVYTIELRATATPADARLRAFSQGVPVTDGGTINFGSTRSDRALVRVITIKNEGRAALMLGTPEVTGTGFSVLSLPRSPLGAGRATKFRVRLDPSMTGAIPLGALVIPTNIEGLETFTLNLTADVTVVNPALAVTGPGGAIDNGSTFDFGETDLNLGLSHTFSISNPGSANLTIGGFAVSGTGYALTRMPAATIAPGRSTTFVIRLFSAAVLNPASGTVSFSTNVMGSASFTFSLTGRVNIIPPTPELEVTEGLTGPGGVPVMQVVLQNSVRTYGPVAAGNTVARSYTIRNRGTGPMALGGLALTNTIGTAFALTSGSPLPATLAPNATHMISVNWLPLVAGTSEATIMFMNDDPDDMEGPVFMFTLRGTASPANVAFSVRYTGFGGIPLTRRPMAAPFEYPFSLGAGPGGGTDSFHNTSFDAFALRNDGATPLIVSNVNITPNTVWIPEQVPPPTFPIPTPTPTGQEVRINVTHRPVVNGQSIGLVEILSDAAALSPWQFEITQWTNNWFSTMGGLSGGVVRSLREFDSDADLPGDTPKMYAGGAFTTPAGSPRIAALVGGTWQALAGGGINDGQVNALAVFDEPGDAAPAVLFAGGAFTSIGTPAQTSINNIAKWNGTAWGPVGSIVSNGVSGGTPLEIVRAMVAADLNGSADPPPSLYVAGTFTGAGPITGVQSIARWDGTAWSRLLATNDGVTGGGINALAVFDEDGSGPGTPVLYAGGSFTHAGGLMDRANGIARFNGTAWSILGPANDAGVSGGGARVNALVVWDADGADGPIAPLLVVAGSFLEAANITDANNIAAWSGTAWQGISPGGFAGGEIFSLTVFDEDSFHSEDADGMRATQRTMPGRLIAGGNFGFLLPDGSTANNVARWDGNRWTSLGDTSANGTNGLVRAVGPFDADGLQTMGSPNNPARLFIGGSFTQVTELIADPNPDVIRAVNNIAVWGFGTP
jgi:hypothetical protein